MPNRGQQGRKNNNSTPVRQNDSNAVRQEFSSVAPLTDADYEFLFTQLLEGVAHGWHQVKIANFFQRLGERSQQQQWVAWLQRYSTKILASSDDSRQQLGARMMRLGVLAYSTPSLREIGTIAAQIGRKLYFGKEGSLVWEYDGSDLEVSTPSESPVPRTETLETLETLEEDNLEQPDNLTTESDLTLNSTFAPDTPETSPSEPELDQLTTTPETSPSEPELDQLTTTPETSPSEPELDQLTTTPETSPSEPVATPVSETTLTNSQQPSEIDTEIPPLPLTQANISESESIAIETPSLTQSQSELDWPEEMSPQLSAANLDSPVSMQTSVDEREQVNKTEQSALDLVEGWFNLGLKQASASDFNGAIKSWEKALELDPQLSEAWHNKGSALGRLGKYEAAVQSFERALAINPQNYQAWNDRAHALYQLSRWEEAAASWNKVLKIIPGDYQVWYHRGCALEKLQHIEEAIASYEKALEIKPDFQPARSRYINLLADKL